MPDINVVVTDFIEANLVWEAEEFNRRGIRHSFHQLNFAPAREVVAATCEADVVVTNYTPITSEIVDGFRKCNLVIRHGTGYDNFDLAALERAGIPLCYIPDYCIEEVAEHAIALIFACGRKFADGAKAFSDSAGQSRWNYSGISPAFRMAGRTLGIVGCGRIGSRVLRKLQSFGFTFLVCDPYLTSERRRELGIDVVDKERLFREADFITLHTPLNDETRQMVNADLLALMKPSACLINTSRGPVIDTRALASALKAGTIAGAGIDVYDADPPAADCPLLDLENTILTPHLAWYSEDSAWNVRKLIIVEIERFISGLPPRYVANPGYVVNQGRS
jgi:D-3-phosphoglycerate dehydrogenase